jgi:rhodanese-related sulfurtransferase
MAATNNLRVRASNIAVPAICLVLIALCSAVQAQTPSVRGGSLPNDKQTSLHLYVTASEAYAKWKADPEKVKILDVRTTEEYLYVGHAPMVWNIPAFVQVYEWDPAKKHFPMKPNPQFVAQVTAIAKPGDTILAMCRSGGRSAMAVNQLAQAGFTQVYNITDGMEGDSVEDPDSVFRGQRMKNGWKNSGLPWTYEVAPDRIVLPKTR